MAISIETKSGTAPREVTSASPTLDAYAIQLVLLLGGVCVLVASLLGELAVVLLDPRVRLTAKEA